MRSRLMMAVVMLVGTVALTTPALAQQTAPALREPDVIFVPTPAEVVTAMLKLANVTPKDVVYDLGCGDGMIVAAAAREFGARAVGLDINPVRVKEANERIAKDKVNDKVKIINADLFEHPIGEATVVTLYLLQSLNEKLIPKLNRELKPGTRIVSQTFSMGDKYPPEKTVEVAGRSVYLWTVPMKAKQ